MTIKASIGEKSRQEVLIEFLKSKRTVAVGLSGTMRLLNVSIIQTPGEKPQIYFGKIRDWSRVVMDGEISEDFGSNLPNKLLVTGELVIPSETNLKEYWLVIPFDVKQEEFCLDLDNAQLVPYTS